MDLGYDELKAVKRDIISVSIKMWGNDGPYGYQTGYAPCFAALAGLASLVGYPGGPPLGTSMRYGDSTVGAAAAYAAVVALLYRELTGEGQFVDVSAVETLSSMIGDCLLAQELTGAQLLPDGNRHADMAPHSCYPCVGGDWISIAVDDETRWRLLCQRARCDRTGRRPALRHPGGSTQAHRRARPRNRQPHPKPRRGEAGATTQNGRCAGRQERNGTGHHQRSAAVGPRTVPFRQLTTARASDRSSGRHGGCQSCEAEIDAVRPTSARTTTMFVTRSCTLTRWSGR